jgi:hypothetical protein
MAAPTCYIDRIDLLSAIEVRGVVRNLTRKARVIFTSGQIPEDYYVLADALTSAGIPVAMSFANGAGNVPLGAPYNNLVLIERNPEIVEGDTGTVDVVLKYEHILDGPNQLLFTPPRGIIYGKGQSSITQKPTNFYNANLNPQPGTLLAVIGSAGTITLTFLNNNFQTGQQIVVSWTGPTGQQYTWLGTITSVSGATITVTGPNPTVPPSTPFPPGTTPVIVTLASPLTGPQRQQITVAHTFPLTDPVINGQVYTNLPNTIVQIGEINIAYPQQNFQFQGLIQVSNPWTIVNALIRTINATTWFDQPPGTWICSEVKFEIYDTNGPLTGPLYKFEFEFQNDSDGWNPTVVFKDQRTGRPPANVQPAIATDANGILNQAYNPLKPNQLQPAGYWQVPSLRSVDYNVYFTSFFEGITNPPEGG